MLLLALCDELSALRQVPGHRLPAHIYTISRNEAFSSNAPVIALSQHSATRPLHTVLLALLFKQGTDSTVCSRHDCQASAAPQGGSKSFSCKQIHGGHAASGFLRQWQRGIHEILSQCSLSTFRARSRHPHAAARFSQVA